MLSFCPGECGDRPVVVTGNIRWIVVAAMTSSSLILTIPATLPVSEMHKPMPLWRAYRVLRVIVVHQRLQGLSCGRHPHEPKDLFPWMFRVHNGQSREPLGFTTDLKTPQGSASFKIARDLGAYCAYSILYKAGAPHETRDGDLEHAARIPLGLNGLMYVRGIIHPPSHRHCQQASLRRRCRCRSIRSCSLKHCGPHSRLLCPTVGDVWW